MINSLRHIFQIDGNCDCLTETQNTLIEMYDCYNCIPDKQRSYIKTASEEPVHFTLHNPNQNLLTFAALDNCLFKAHDASRCDLIIGNSEKLFFVEIKQVKTGQRSKARLNAVGQLRRTLIFFIERLNLEATKLMAVICFKAKQVYPAQSATRTAHIVEFKERFNTNLLEGSSATF